jgi:hypothetical protein
VTRGHAFDLVVATLAVNAASVATASTVTWLVRNGPLSTRALVFMLIFAAGVMIGIPATDPWIRRRAERRTQGGRQ